MPQITRNSGFTTQDIVTATKLHNLVDTAVISKELLTAQTLMAPYTVAPNDYLLGYDVSDTSMRTMSVENILNSSISTTFGNTWIEGTLYAVTNEGSSSLNINTNLGIPVFQVQGFDELRFDSKYTVINTDRFFLTIDSDDSKKVLEYKFFEDETSEREERDVTIDIKHPASTNADSRTYITTDNKTEVDFKGPVKHTGSLTLSSSEVTIGEGEEAEVVDLLNPPSLGVFDITFDKFPDPTGFTSLRISAANVPDNGFLVLNQTIVVPDNEIWVVRYDVSHRTNTDDNYLILFKKDNTVVYEYSTSNIFGDRVSHHNINYTYRLESGTHILTSRLALTSGGDTDSIQYNFAPVLRTIYKMRV